MSPRKSPYKHPVTDYTRKDGKRVERYIRGQGKKPSQTPKGKPRTNSNQNYRVTLILSRNSELYPVSGGSFSEASKEGLKHLIAAEVPLKIRVKLS